MPTQHLFRLLIGIRAADKAGYETWWKANVDTAPGGGTFSVGLSATGAAPATHYVACMALTAAQLRLIVIRLCTLAGVSFPGNWNLLTRAQKRDWLRSQIPALKSAANIKALVCDDNDGAWDDYSARILGAGVKPISVGLP